MGQVLSCFKRHNSDQGHEHSDHLISDRYCHKCSHHYLSNYEYNKHIVECNRIYGDL